MKKPNHYIDKKVLYEQLSAYRRECDKAKEAGEERPPLPKEIVEAIFLIAENTARRSNFSGYSYIDEMILDAVETCVKYIHNFDPNQKQKNAFGYIGLICWRAFTKRIKLEHKEALVKRKVFENAYLFDALVTQGDDNYFHMQGNDVMNDLMTYKRTDEKPAKKNDKTGLDLFIE